VSGLLGRLLWSRYYMPVSVLLAVVLLLGTGANLLMRSGAWQPAFLAPRPTIAITGPGFVTTPQPLEAYVLGAVLRPGVYALPGGARVRELVVAAGGLLDNADITRVDLAAVLIDGQAIYVPRLGEQIPLQLGGKLNLNVATETDLHNALGNIQIELAAQLQWYLFAQSW